MWHFFGFPLIALWALTCCLRSTLALPNLPSSAVLPDLYEASIAELQDGLEKGLFTSVDLVKVRELYSKRYKPHILNILSGLFCSYRRSESGRPGAPRCLGEKPYRFETGSCTRCREKDARTARTFAWYPHFAER